MTAIRPPGLLLAEIRAQALASRRNASARSSHGPVEHRPAATAEPPRDWSAEMAEAIVAIDPDDPKRTRKAFRAYLQAVLARECGFRQTDDPAFQALVDQVQDAMELDPKLEDAMRTAGRMLLDSAKP